MRLKNMRRMRMLDFYLLEMVHRNEPVLFWDHVMRAFTRLGDGWTYLIITVLFYLQGSLYSAAWVLTLVAIETLIYLAVKFSIRIPRPFLIRETIQAKIKVPDNYAFPSGHAGSSLVAALALASLFPQFGPLFLLLAFGVSLSRVWLAAHFPSDVLVGWAIGLVTFFYLSHTTMFQWVQHLSTSILSLVFRV